MSATVAISVYAANRTAYSIGVNYSTSDSDTVDDFQSSAKNAAAAYKKISDMSSLVSYTPTLASLKSHINDNVVFLNSHASYDHIAFRYKNSKSEYVKVGYIMDDNTTLGGTSYVGLNKCSMNNVELITFAGCKTANTENGSNITSAAVTRGAKCAVGFTGEITSRGTAGKAWLKSYNNYLASGCNVGEAVHKATADNSTSDLGKNVNIQGYGAQRIAPIAESNAIENMDDMGSVYAADRILSSENALFDFMSAYDNNFDSSKYKYYINIFDKARDTGMVVFNYYIDDNIITNKSYVIYIENGLVADISESNVDKNINEEALCERASVFSSYLEAASYSENENGETKEYYEYDYNIGELRYVKAEFVVGETGEIIENTVEYII